MKIKCLCEQDLQRFRRRVCGSGKAVLHELHILPARIFRLAAIGSFDIARAYLQALLTRFLYCCSSIDRSFCGCKGRKSAFGAPDVTWAFVIIVILGIAS
jgi:hypothetical protein